MSNTLQGCVAKMSLRDPTNGPEPAGSPPGARPPSPAATALSGMTHWTNMPPMPNPDQIRDVLTTMKQTLGNLGVTSETLDKHSAKVADIDFEYDYGAQIASLRKHMAASEKKQEKRMDDLKTLLKDVLKDEIVPHIRTKIDDQITIEMNAAFEKHVADELSRLISPRHQEQIVQDSQQLGEVHINLHNSEARRANALIRSNHLNDPLHPLLTREGVVSNGFPEDLSQLFALDDDAAMALNEKYGMTDVGGGKERNLNRFMQFCGISYQMVSVAFI